MNCMESIHSSEDVSVTQFIVSIIYISMLMSLNQARDVMKIGELGKHCKHIVSNPTERRRTG